MMLSTFERSSVTVRGRATSVSRNEQISAIAFPTALDWMALAWREDALRGIVFGYPSQRQARSALGRGLYLPGQFWHFQAAGQLTEQPPWVADVMASLQRFAEGEPAEFSGVPLALDHLSRRDIVSLDNERKAAMVSNLLVVLCGDKSTQPIINTGTIYQ